MNFEEYKAQSEKLPRFSVEVRRKDCLECRIFNPENTFRKVNGIKMIVVLVIDNEHHTYVVKEDHSMYTMDRDGNPRNPTVFKYVTDDTSEDY